MTVIARAPLRIGLGGGGTDLPSYADRYGGLVISTTIDRYVYAIVTSAPDDVLQITAADSSSVLSRRDHLFDSSLFWGDDYRLPLAIVRQFGIHGGRRIFLASEVPPGTGLGSSSSTAVALITALAADQCQQMSKDEVAELACHIEIDELGMPIGKQDQFAAAFGGLNVIEFHQGETVVQPCAVPEQTYRDLQDRLLLFFTGQRRRSTDILTAQRAATMQPDSATVRALHEIKAFASEMIDAITRGDLHAVGALLDASWQQKQRLAPGISSGSINAWYDAAREAGATGGKITGAGGGGFLLLFAEPERRGDVIHCLSKLGLVWVDTQLEREGASTLLDEAALALVR